MTLGGVFLEVFLSICYNRTGAFLVAGIYLIEYDREFVILLVSIQYTVSLTNKLYIYIHTHTHTDETSQRTAENSDAFAPFYVFASSNAFQFSPGLISENASRRKYFASYSAHACTRAWSSSRKVGNPKCWSRRQTEHSNSTPGTWLVRVV